MEDNTEVLQEIKKTTKNNSIKLSIIFGVSLLILFAVGFSWFDLLTTALK